MTVSIVQGVGWGVIPALYPPPGKFLQNSPVSLSVRCRFAVGSRMLSNGKGRLHLTAAVEGWLVPGKNPFGLYFYMEDVDVWATEFRDEILEKNGPENKPWGMYEFAMSDPDETLVRDAVAFRSQWTAISSYSAAFTFW